GMDYESAEQFAKDEAERLAEMHVFDAIEENLPGEEEEGEWNWEALAKFANTRWGLNLRDRDLKREGRDGVAQVIIDKARESINRVDLSDGAPVLDPDFAVQTIVAWVYHKFGIELDLEKVKSMDLPELKALVCERAEECYDRKEFEYPVLAGLLRYTSGADQHERIDREGLVAWAKNRFHGDIDVDDLRNKQREEIRAELLKHSAKDRENADHARREAAKRVEKIFDSSTSGQLAGAAGSKGSLQALSHWLHESLGYEMSVDEIGRLEREELEIKVYGAVEDRYRPEIRRMERQLLLQIVDSAWKDHLLAMDHLRSAVGLAGYAQMDPKVEYKREGMRLFENMWTMLGERVTDLIFRMEQLDEGFVGSTWVETSARHDEARSASELVSEQQRAIDSSQEAKVETIRNRTERVGRNDPCPCGSGRKYKQCCMRKNTPAA
ncbi:MAG TPA: SEC-C metal-binding domain-containing protein, partial [Pirellulaceae bacterium]|nr:SEC-C metal-binding domain-containing protein [Pirellulaceae bacterium]